VTLANHFLAGGLVAVTVKQPALVVPLAIASHFALDALPHHGYNRGGYATALKHKATFLLEAGGIVGLLVLFTTGIFGWNLATAGGLLGILPDAEWPFRYLLYERKGKRPPETFITRFHRKIQWCERPWGWMVEICFFLAGYILLVRIA
jgi:hypothetical protein